MTAFLLMFREWLIHIIKKTRLDSDSIICYSFHRKLDLSVKGMSPFLG